MSAHQPRWLESILQIPLWMPHTQILLPDPLGLINSLAHKRTTVTHSRSRSSTGYSVLLTGRLDWMRCKHLWHVRRWETQASPDGLVSPNGLRNRKWPVGFEMCFGLSTLKLWFDNKRLGLTHAPGSLMLARLAYEYSHFVRKRGKHTYFNKSNPTILWTDNFFNSEAAVGSILKIFIVKILIWYGIRRPKP